MSVQIAASLLSADFRCLGDQIAEVEQAGADLIHVDVMDGVFVPNISYGLPIVSAAKQSTTLPIDVHLMTVHPERHIASFAEAGADIITVHFETASHLHRVIQQIRDVGVKPAIAINPHMPVSMLQDILPFVDMILVMTVNPGYPGQRFISQTLDKLRQLRAQIHALNLPINIEVDGGIDPTTAPQVVASGANILVAGTAVFRAPGGIEAGINSLRKPSL